MQSYTPVYTSAFKIGQFKTLKKELRKRLLNCKLCPRNCGINRMNDEKGVCNTGKFAMVSSASPHFGEEPPLVGQNGSGTVFFTNCNLLCSFCQNHDISHNADGVEIRDDDLADLMIRLQEMGCHNINLVTPSHVVPQIITALEKAIRRGLSIPLVYNTSCYDNIETLKFLDGIIDIYMPDLKFFSAEIARKTCNAVNYPDVARKAVIEMHRQVGNLIFNKRGIAQKGLLIRHLVMPGQLNDTREIIKFIVNEISPLTHVNIMPQYRPFGNLDHFPEFNRRLTNDEYEEAMNIAKDEGLVNLFL